MKGLYARALGGEIKKFIGVSDPYEAPLQPEVVVHSDRESVATAVSRILAVPEAQGYLKPVLQAVEV